MTHRHHILARRCWIFDLDGTLTLPVHDFAAIRTALGMTETDPDILGFLASLPAAEATAKHARLIEIEYELAARTAAAPGAGRLLDRLLRRGVQIGILTRNTREIALHTLGLIGLKQYFRPDAVLGRDEAAPKPHPEGVAKLLDAWGSVPDEAVMVGDYLFDLQVGRAAGIATIHVDRSGTFRWPELADLAVANLEELAEGLTHAVPVPAS
ncbi:HAD family hydrolase [Geomobilimonas luticola]|uniref:HAD-IA family hydrolase n=1 Tax=Geomobilimonas luticola TaxID=1114878 RepID=A0ABS5S8H2_9BACT|nr:HAD-IA family hydrolase [Geomobilimonas luticola]MBT0651670.1 HAD-IA family hydrolase [Geomobilimonas luticola]